MGRRKATDRLTPLELELMKVLWDLGPSTVHAVQEALAGERRLAYTTVQTMLNLLFRKKKVERILENRAYVYRAVASRTQETRSATGDLIDRFFGGSAQDLVLSLVENERLTPEELERLQRLVATPSEGQGEPSP